MRIVAIIQARMQSTRLPGKTLTDLCGQPLLAHVLRRVRQADFLDSILVATTDLPADDDIARWCSSAALACYRGDSDDVLHRYVQAARLSRADVVVRITADCPFIDPQVVNDAVRLFIEAAGCPRPLDYLSNTIEPTYPDGLDVEVFSRAALEIADRDARLPSQREHVTPLLRENPSRFAVMPLLRQPSLAHLRWTVDEPQDLEFARAIMQRLGVDCTTDDILALLQREPQLSEINACHQRNAGYQSSLQRDRQHAISTP